MSKRPFTGWYQTTICACFFLAAFVTYTWANRFPYFYHSDEESKALQLLHGYHNFWHPLLMLNLTQAFASLMGDVQDSQSVTMIGRTLAAFFSAAGVTAFVLFAWRRKGMWPAVLTGCLLLTLPLLFEVSHYCKEDPGLFMGLALTLLFLERYLTTGSVFGLGFAAGLATSAKYPGALLIVGILPVILWRDQWSRTALQFLAAAFLTILAINWQWLFHLPDLFTGIHRESAMLVAGHDGVATHFPHADYWRILLYQHGWPILLVAGAGLLIAEKRQTVTLEFGLGLGCLVLVAVMCYSAKISDRYLLPVMAVTLYLAACGVQSLARFVPQKLRLAGTTLLIALLFVQPLNLLSKTIHDFRSDTRGELAHWVKDHVPREELVATSLWTRLPGFYQGQFVTGQAPADYVADLGNLAQLRKMGFRWVAVADVESRRFEVPLPAGDAAAQAHFLRRRAFYRELQSTARLRWSAPAGVVYHLQPGLRLYQL